MTLRYIAPNLVHGTVSIEIVRNQSIILILITSIINREIFYTPLKQINALHILRKKISALFFSNNFVKFNILDLLYYRPVVKIQIFIYKNNNI